MKKVTITFEYDEEQDGALGEEFYDMIIEKLNEYGNNVNVEEIRIL